MDFLVRIQLALNATPYDLSNDLNIPLNDVLDRHGPRSEQSDTYADPFWSEVAMLVDTRIGMLMGVREELRRKMRIDMRKRAEARRKVLER